MAYLRFICHTVCTWRHGQLNYVPTGASQYKHAHPAKYYSIHVTVQELIGRAFLVTERGNKVWSQLLEWNETGLSFHYSKHCLPIHWHCQLRTKHNS